MSLFGEYIFKKTHCHFSLWEIGVHVYALTDWMGLSGSLGRVKPGFG